MTSASEVIVIFSSANSICKHSCVILFSKLGLVSHSKGDSGGEISTRWHCVEEINHSRDSWLVSRYEAYKQTFHARSAILDRVSFMPIAPSWIVLPSWTTTSTFFTWPTSSYFAWTTTRPYFAWIITSSYFTWTTSSYQRCSGNGTKSPMLVLFAPNATRTTALGVQDFRTATNTVCRGILVPANLLPPRISRTATTSSVHHSDFPSEH